MTLKELRIAANLTQEAVAKELMVTQGTVSKWETGEGAPLKKYHGMMAKLYGCTVDELLESMAKQE